jgi:hypothetical protein
MTVNSFILSTSSVKRKTFPVMKRLTPVILIFLGSVTAVLILNRSVQQPDQYDFERLAPYAALAPQHVWNVNEPSHYIAGKYCENIYLGNNRSPGTVKLVNVRMSDYPVEQAIGKTNSIHQATSIVIDSSDLFVIDLISYKISHGSMANLEPRPLIDRDIFFAEAVPISKKTVIVRTFDKGVREYVLGRLTNSYPFVERAPGLLEKQIDGLFCTDGMLHYNRNTNQLIYVYFYRNQFITMDTSLNLAYRANTIDPVAIARIKVAKIESQNTLTLASPPYIVNRRSHTSGDLLFIHSEIKAKNEERHSFKKRSAIDVYRLHDGTYQFSFYIPQYKGYEMKEFKVFDSTLVAIHGHYLLTYRIPGINKILKR